MNDFNIGKIAFGPAFDKFFVGFDDQFNRLHTMHDELLKTFLAILHTTLKRLVTQPMSSNLLLLDLPNKTSKLNWLTTNWLLRVAQRTMIKKNPSCSKELLTATSHVRLLLKTKSK